MLTRLFTLVLTPLTICAGFIIGIPLSLRAQEVQSSYVEHGQFPVRNFPPEDYKYTQGHYQNWHIVTDKNGMVYSANGTGVLEYDGVSWRLIHHKDLHAVRTIAVDDQNVKWIGADRELGYLAPDSTGTLQYISLKDKIPSSDPLVANVWKVFPDGQRVLFVAANTIYSWENNQFTIIPSSGELHREFKVRSAIYFRINGQGLYQLIGNSLELIPEGEKFKDLIILSAMPYEKDGLLLVTRSHGMYVYQNEKVTKLDSDVIDYFSEHALYKGLPLTDSSYLFATLRGGVVLTDKQGKQLTQVTEENGILNNQVHGMAVDGHMGVWLALQTGISQFHPALPYTVFDEKLNLRGTATGVVRHQGTIFISTHEGLFKLASSGGQTQFQRIEEINTGCFALLSVGNDLLVATRDGAFKVTGNEITHLNQVLGGHSLWRSKSDTSRVFMGHMNGLFSMYYENGRWQDEYHIKPIEEHVMSINEDDKGNLWLGTSLKEIIKLDLSQLPHTKEAIDFSKYAMQRFDTTHGLPTGYTAPYIIDGQVWVSSNQKNGPVFQYDAENNQFLRRTDFGKKFGIDSLQWYPIAIQEGGQHVLIESLSEQGNVYRYSASRHSSDGSYHVLRVYDEPVRSFLEKAVLWDRGQKLWLGAEHTLRYDLDKPLTGDSKFQTHVRKVTAGQDSLLFGGELTYSLKPVLDYKVNGLRFEFAAQSWGSNPNSYQYQLVGFDKDWSEWTEETRKDYTNLPEGSYQFMARAQDIYGNVSSVGAFEFQILPPWYRSWWAYLLYIGVFIGILYAIIRFRARQLKVENLALERAVHERTEEVRKQAKQLKKQATKLKELDRVKSRFFANISHEFRTPLTLILGPLRDRLQQPLHQADLNDFKLMQRNAQRLQRLINQLLDLSKIESNNLKLNVERRDVFLFLKAIVGSFSSYAHQRNITFEVLVPAEPLLGYIDRDSLEKVLYNLISNAFKFTKDGGKISIIARHQAGILTIKVSDTGCGIAPEKLTYIFDRFYQADDSMTREQQGTGIGLALTKELVALHRGSIEVQSEADQGTVFTIKLPTEASNYHESEIFNNNNGFDKKIVAPIVETPVSPACTNQPAVPEAPIVLIVEDHRELRHYMKNHLSQYRVIEAADGVKGLKIATNQIPDLIISDVMMPNMDGIDMLNKLKRDERTSHIPVILLTAKADLPSKIEGLETGADDYLTKPFYAEELQVRCQNLIEQRKNLRARFSNTLLLQPKDIAVTSADEAFLTRVMEVVDRYIDDSSFSVETFLREMGMSRMQLHRKLKALTDYSTTEFIRIQRLKRAAQLLRDSDLSISEVCYSVGFNGLSYFTKCFKEQYGTTPSEYDVQHQD